nr:uncharacterized protein LOC132779707 [Anolis sagrei ordinatus]
MVAAEFVFVLWGEWPFFSGMSGEEEGESPAGGGFRRSGARGGPERCEKEAERLPPHRPYDCAIDLVLGAPIPRGRLYSLSEPELAALWEFLDTNLRNGFIHPSQLPAGAPVLFVKKKSGELRLCNNYWALNNITIKNRYPLPLIPDLLDRLRVFTKLDLRGACNFIAHTRGDAWKSAFQTRFGSFKYRAMPFGFCNASNTLSMTSSEANPSSLPKYHLGKENISVPNKVIMVIGATGSGKTTLINGMVNYILGVQWEDEFRFKLIHEETNQSQAESQTSKVTAYVVNYQEGFKIPYSLTIIDTPGFGDTRGIEHDRLITEKIRKFFSNRGGIDHIDSVCFVVQASLARLTKTQKYIFDSVLSIFGRDIKDNIQVLVTFADGQTPPVIEAIKEANVPCAKEASRTAVHFKFNNSALFASNAGECAESLCFDQMFWEMGQKSMKTFFDSLNNLETRSITLTKEVLRERKELETFLVGLKEQIKVALVKVEELETLQKSVDQHKADIEANKYFEYEIEEVEFTKKEIEDCATNCRKLENHAQEKFKYDRKTIKKKMTYNDLKARFGNDLSKITSEKEKEIEILSRLLKKVSQSHRRLQEISLNPSPLTTQEYISLLLQAKGQEIKDCAGGSELMKGLPVTSPAAPRRAPARRKGRRRK